MSASSGEGTYQKPLTSKEKRAIYMARIRGSADSEYRHHERENNARAMRKKRSEDPIYREHERRQNRAHMAEVRRENSEYRQREYIKNRHRMALKRTVISPSTVDRTKPTSNNIIDSIYQTLENNLQSSHISFIPYQSNYDSFQQLSNNNDYRLQETGSSSDSNSRSTGSA